VVADSYQFDEKQEQNPYQSEKLDPDQHLSNADPQPWGPTRKFWVNGGCIVVDQG
jgi:hypothetical protein